MANMLHTVNKSPFERTTLDSCLRLAKKGSTIILMEDGVYAALNDTATSDKVTERRGGDFRFYVLGPDIDARGLGDKPLIEGVEVIDYGTFVDLAAEHDAVNAWL